MSYRDELRASLVEALWVELKRQSEAGLGYPYIIRADGLIDGRVDMDKIAGVALELISPSGPEFWPQDCIKCGYPTLANSNHEAKRAHKTYSGKDCDCLIAVNQ